MLYVIRHGKTDWNAKYKLQGRTNIPLNEEGRAMAREARERYQNIKFDVCFCSPLDRARETAELLLAGRELPIVIDERLREMSFGPYEGTEDVFHKPDCPIYKLFMDPEHYVAPEGAESFEELFARTGEFLKEKVEPLLSEGKDVLIVGHGALNCCIIDQCRNIPLAHYWDCGLKNCELMKI